jgi:hypothetical protein
VRVFETRAAKAQAAKAQAAEKDAAELATVAAVLQKHAAVAAPFQLHEHVHLKFPPVVVMAVVRFRNSPNLWKGSSVLSYNAQDKLLGSNHTTGHPLVARTHVLLLHQMTVEGIRRGQGLQPYLKCRHQK